MDDNNSVNLDLEYKRYLQIMRPYLGQLVDTDIIDICNAWIQRLTSCSEKEKALRNRYVFALCYQLAKGVLDEPFLQHPSVEELTPISGGFDSETSTEVEYIVIDSEQPSTKVLFNNKKPIVSETEYTQEEFDDDKRNESREFDSIHELTPYEEKPRYSPRKQTIICYTCPKVKKINTNENPGEEYEYRANNLILKLREIKKQNLLLHEELLALKEESKINEEEFNEINLLKVDNATSAFKHSESIVNLKSLKTKLEEVQSTRDALILRIGNLQDQIDNFTETKKHEIDQIEANHKLEIIELKSSMREDFKEVYERKLEELKQHYESTFKDMQHKTENVLKNETKAKEEIIIEKDSVIQARDAEIALLKAKVEEQKNDLHSFQNKFMEKPNEDLGSESLKLKVQELEKRLNKMEKSKIKSVRAYESKLAYLQREKHLTECSLQLQLVRQRTQVVNEISDENQVDLVTALDKLQSKYKEIVANVQATAIQRRMQDQTALDAILQAACGIKNENVSNSTNHSQFSANTVRQTKDQSYDSDISGLVRIKVGNAVVGNKSYGDDGMTGYCLEGERLGELFEKVYIPQRDTGDGPLKK